MSRTERFTVSVQRNGSKERHEVFTKYSVIACPIQHYMVKFYTSNTRKHAQEAIKKVIKMNQDDEWRQMRPRMWRFVPESVGICLIFSWRDIRKATEYQTYHTVPDLSEPHHQLPQRLKENRGLETAIKKIWDKIGKKQITTLTVYSF